jgi:hypothetical protein
MCSYRSHLFSILFLHDLNLLFPELTSILSRDPERCEILFVLVVINSLSVEIRWVSVNATVFRTELRIYSFVFLKLRRILYVFNICLTMVMKKLHHHITNRQRIRYNIPQAVVYSTMFLNMGEIVARNMSSWFGFINKPLLLHLVGFLLYHLLYVCLQCHGVKMNWNFMERSVISLFFWLSDLNFGVFITTGTESLPKQYLQKPRFIASSFIFKYLLERNLLRFLIL